MTPFLKAAAMMIGRFVPEFRLVAKSDSFAMKLMGWLMPATKGYFTTIGFTCYYPDRALTDPLVCPVVFHEGAHALRTKRLGIVAYSALYCFPWTMVPIFLGLASWHWWLGLGALICAAPYVARWRTACELEGYRVNMLIDYWSGGEDALADVSWYARQLYGGTYYFCTTKGRATKLVGDTAAAIVASKGDVSGDPYLSAVRTFLGL